MPVLVDDQEVQRKLQEVVSRLLPEQLRKGMEQACLLVESDAKHRCPVDDGTLRGSITHAVEIEGADIVGYVGTNVEYAPYVHQGTGIYAVNGDGRKEVPWSYQTADGKWHKTSGQKPSPFLQDAIDAKQGEILSCFLKLDAFGGNLT